GPLLNGWVNYETWVPAKALTFDGTEAFLKQYQARAGAEGVEERRPRAVPRHGHADRAHAGAIQDRQRDLSLREGEVGLSALSRMRRFPLEALHPGPVRSALCCYPPPWSAPTPSRTG